MGLRRDARPVAVAAFVTAIHSGAGEAEQYVEEDGQRVRCPPTVMVRGSGTSSGSVHPPASMSTRSDSRTTTTWTDDGTLVLARVLDAPFLPGERILVGASRDATPLILATLL